MNSCLNKQGLNKNSFNVLNCSFDENCDLAFEDSTVNATINTRMVSIKNPKSGKIKLKGLDKLIIDEYVKAPNDCKIEIIES